MEGNKLSVIYHLRSWDEQQVAAWQKYFKDTPEVQISFGNILELRVDALVSPANCFGFMDGGIDRAYSEFLGWHIQERLRAKIRNDFDGELPIGMALLVETDHPEIPYLISAPTMRAPVDVSKTLNAYLAFRAVLRLVTKTNQSRPGTIRSVLCPGMATGTGEMPPEICAKQMYAAYQQETSGQPSYPASINEALLEHYRLLRPDE